MGSLARCLVVSRQDETLGVLMAFFSDCAVVPWAIGINYSALQTYNIYHVALLETIRESIACGALTIHFGRGSYGVKERYGARPVPLLMALGGNDVDRSARHEWLNILSTSKLHRISAEIGPLRDLGE